MTADARAMHTGWEEPFKEYVKHESEASQALDVISIQIPLNLKEL